MSVTVRDRIRPVLAKVASPAPRPCLPHPAPPHILKLVSGLLRAPPSQSSNSQSRISILTSYHVVQILASQFSPMKTCPECKWWQETRTRELNAQRTQCHHRRHHRRRSYESASFPTYKHQNCAKSFESADSCDVWGSQHFVNIASSHRLFRSPT